MKGTKHSVISSVEGILQDYEDGYKWGSLVRELTYSDLKSLVSLAPKADLYHQALLDISNISPFTDQQALDKMNSILLPFLNEIKK